MGRTLAAETRKPSVSLYLHSAVYCSVAPDTLPCLFAFLFLICNTEVLPRGFTRLWEVRELYESTK